MTTIRIINDAQIAESDFNKIVKAVKYFVPKVTSAWGMASVNIEANGTPVAGDWLVYATESRRKVGAAGYHGVLNGSPVAYCSPKASGRLFGTYIKALTVKGKLIHKALFSPGLVSVICHEVAEMLCDPYIQTMSAKDPQGRNWLIEVCDHVFGSYEVFVSDGTNCVLPDVTTPAFYNLQASGPYSIFNALVAPFVMTPKGYAYWMDSTGKLQKV